MNTSLTLWTFTSAFLIALVGVDLFRHRQPANDSIKYSAWASLLWTVVGLGFALVLWAAQGGHEASLYVTSYLLERALSIDNVFVFVIILGYFAVPSQLRHQALLWGVVGALLMRIVFILVGVSLMDQFKWMTYVFGGVLIVTALRLAMGNKKEVDPSRNPVLKLLRRLTPISDTYAGNKLVTKDVTTKKRIATPLVAVLLVIGTTDLVFAIDSVPAVFAITTDTFIVFAANAFSLLGLRPLATLLAGVMNRFIYLQPALAIILGLIGLEMLAQDFIEVAVFVPLAAIVVIVGGAILLSLFKTRNVETGVTQ